MRTADGVQLTDMHNHKRVIEKRDKKEPEWLWRLLLIALAITIGSLMGVMYAK